MRLQPRHLFRTRDRRKISSHVIMVVLIFVLLLSSCTTQPLVVTVKELNLYTFAAYVPEELLRGYEAATGVTVNDCTPFAGSCVGGEVG